MALLFKQGSRRNGFALGETLGVLAIVLLLIIFVIPDMFSALLQAQKDDESRNLEEIADATIAHVKLMKHTPGYDTAKSWYRDLSEQMNVDEDVVRVNSNGFKRYFVWEKGKIPSLPYQQTAKTANINSLTRVPDQRIMFVTNLNGDFPLPGLGAEKTSGPIAPSVFSALWGWDGKEAIAQIPSLKPDASDLISGLKIKRVRLYELFSEITLNNRKSLVEGEKLFDNLTNKSGPQILLNLPGGMTPNIDLRSFSYSSSGFKSESGNSVTMSLLINVTLDDTKIEDAQNGSGGPAQLTGPYKPAFEGMVSKTPVLATFHNKSDNEVLSGSIKSVAEITCSPRYSVGEKIAKIVLGETVKLYLLPTTKLTMFDCGESSAELLLVTVNGPDSFWFAPGPPQAWNR